MKNMRYFTLFAIISLFAMLAGCTKKIEGLYANQGVAFKFYADGHVQTMMASMPNAGTSGTYKIIDDVVRLELANGSALELKKEANGLRDAQNSQLYTVTSEDAFTKAAEPGKPASTGHEKIF
jgi:hypothetical protein